MMQKWLNVRVPVDLFDAVDAAAKEQERSRASLVRRVLRQVVVLQPQKAKKPGRDDA